MMRKNNRKVIVLNADYKLINTCNWKRAVVLVTTGKAEIIKGTTKKIKTIKEEIVLPLVIRLIKLIRVIYKRKVNWSRENVFIRDSNRCQYCGEYIKKPQLEHVIPKSRGGKTCFENCVTSCPECNSKKADRIPSEAGMYLLKQPQQPLISEFIEKKLKIQGFENVIKEINIHLMEV